MNGYSRLVARLSITASQFFSPLTIAQAESIKVSYLMTAKQRRALGHKVKTYLSGQGISTILYLGYYAYAHQLASTLNKLGPGEAGSVAVAVLTNKWTARGLSAVILAGIRDNVFSLSEPGPVLSIESVVIEDPIPGNENGAVDPGETCDVIFTLHNAGGAMAAEPLGALHSSNPLLTVPDPEGAWRDIAPYTSQDNTGDCFTVEADPTMTPGTVVTLTLQVQANGGVYERVLTHDITVG